MGGYRVGDKVIRKETGFRTYRDEIGIVAGVDLIEKTYFVAYYDGYADWFPVEDLSLVVAGSYAI